MNDRQKIKRSRSWAVKDHAAGIIDQRTYQLLLAGVAIYWNRRRIVIPKGGLAWEDVRLEGV